MKKARKAMREFDLIKSQLDQTAYIVKNTRDSKLWDHEASVRKRIKALKAMQHRDFKDFESVLDGYLALLDEISKRLLDHYNKRKGMSYRFEEIVGTDRDGYVSSGIISVLVTSHIPKVIAEQFKRCYRKTQRTSMKWRAL
jgi:ATP-dependent RNA helicase SUPV3L1/SUV3